MSRTENAGDGTAGQMRSVQRPPIIQLGDFRVALLTDGFWRNDGGCMMGVVPRTLWSRDHPPDDRNRIRLNLTCPLIIRGSDAVLVDTGIGNRLSPGERDAFDHGEGWLLGGLRALGMEPGDVTHVVLSHLHFDHCGGLVRRRESGTLDRSFPSAKVFVQVGELEVARYNDNSRLRAAYSHVAECLEPVATMIESVEGDTEVVPGVTAHVTGGHTHDHQVVVVSSGAESFVHLADIVPTRSHTRGAWNQAYDLDALRTMEEKARYLSDAARNRWWVSFAHDDRVFATKVSDERGRFVLGENIAVPDRVEISGGSS
jgi:glyoxylase-like metal-dependent hydrolase (beta-lactamase superfamily II)